MKFRMKKQLPLLVGSLGLIATIFVATESAAQTSPSTFYEFTRPNNQGAANEQDAPNPQTTVAGLSQAYLNHNVREEKHWHAAFNGDGSQSAWSIWRVAPGAGRRVVELEVSSTVQARANDPDGELAQVQWSDSVAGPWHDLYAHGFDQKGGKWPSSHQSGTVRPGEPAPMVYLRMAFPAKNVSVLWWDWRVSGKTVPGEPVPPQWLAGRLTLDPARVGLSVWQGQQQTPLGYFTLAGKSKGWVAVVCQGDLQSLRGGDEDGMAVDAIFSTTGSASGDRALHVATRLVDDQALITFRLAPAESGDEIPARRRLVFGYPGEQTHWGHPEGVSHSSDNNKQLIRLDYGPFLLEFAFDQGTVTWAGGPSGYLGMNLSKDAWSALTSEGLSIEARIVPTPKETLTQQRDDLSNQVEDARAYLEAIHIWSLVLENATWVTQVNQRLDELGHALGQIQIDEASESEKDVHGQALPTLPMNAWQNLQDARGTLDEIDGKIQKFLQDHRDELFAKAKKLNDRMSFRIGIGYDRDPTERFLKWATFNMAFFRFAPRRLQIEEPTELFAKVEQIMAEADRYGAKAILLVGGGAKATQPEQLTYSYELLPRVRSGFFRYNYNSKRFRDGDYQDLKTVGELTRNIPNIAEYQMGNEPVWSFSASKIVGYDPGEIGCSNEVWREHIRQKYGSGEAWVQKVHEWRDEVQQGRSSRLFKDDDVKPAVPWDSLDEAGFDPDQVEGLTLVQFLRNRYGALDKLNQAWFGEDQDRYFPNWDHVFPPMPSDKVEGVSVAVNMGESDFPEQWVMDSDRAPRPAPEDVPAWVDWAEFWAHCANNGQLSRQQGLIDGGAKAPASTNIITGHIISNWAAVGADTGGNPWIAMNGLGALGIDFYSTSYLQGYIAAMRDTSHGRPVFIHETEGPKGAYMPLYTFAYGASGTSIWRRSHNIPPRQALNILKATHAMADPELQQHSKPVTDGVALLYSLDSLYLADAMTGSAGYYLANIKGGIYLMTKLQVLFNMYADRQLADSGVPDHVKILFAPGAYSLSDETVASIKQFVEAGGTLVADPEFAQFDRHGRLRDLQTLRWLKRNDHVVMLPKSGVRDWRGTINGSDHNPRRGWGADLPDFAPALEKAIDRHAPRTVTYRDPAAPDTLAKRAPGARLAANGQLFVFVDPWADATQLDLRDTFVKATNLYTGQPLQVRHGQNGTTHVTLDHGPTIVRLTPP